MSPPKNKSARLSSEESLAIVEEMRQKRVASVKDFFTGMAKAVTTDLPGFLMDVADKLAGDTATLGEKDRSAQLFEKMTGIKTASGKGGIDELIGGMINPTSAVGAAKAVILPAMIAGKTAKEVETAQKLLDTGVDVFTVFEKTGIYPGVTDDILRSVISDEGAKLKYGPGLVERSSSASVGTEGPKQRLFLDMWQQRTLGDVLDHPELFARVPKLKDIPVQAQFGGWESGSFSPAANKIFMASTRDENTYKSILLHEVQHAIQERFGMTQGGNSGMFFDDADEVQKALDAINTTFKNQMTSPAQRDALMGTLVKSRNTLERLDSQAYRNYNNLGGEAEARAVQKLLTNPEFIDTVPYDYYDVNSLADLIPHADAVPKVDSDPVVKAIIDFVKRNPEFGKPKTTPTK